MNLIELHDINREFRESKTNRLEVLKGINLSIEEGDFVALMGPSGSGKSTLMHIIGLLDRPTSGLYRLHGRDVSELGDAERAHLRAQKIGFVFQTFHLLARLTALENVLLPTMYTHIPQRLKRAKEIARDLGLTDRLNHLPNDLSGGERQRVAIGRALMANPDLILADEPTGNLDSKTGQQIISVLKKLHREGRTIVLVTHDQAVARQADHILSMHDGRITNPERVKAKVR
jgi:putative ABC transport system ATP-binding protein